MLTNTGGNPFEICQNTTNTFLGSYSITETLQTNVQLSANAIVPLSNSFASFFALGKSPIGDRTSPPPYHFTNGSLTLPDGTLLRLTNQSSIALAWVPGVHYTNSTDSAMAANFPPGAYVMRLDLSTSNEVTITMTVPEVPPAPMLTNYDAAQAIDAGHDFTLQWNPLPATAPGPFIQLVIQDTYGKLIYAARQFLRCTHARPKRNVGGDPGQYFPSRRALPWRAGIWLQLLPRHQRGAQRDRRRQCGAFHLIPAPNLVGSKHLRNHSTNFDRNKPLG